MVGDTWKKRIVLTLAGIGITVVALLGSFVVVGALAKSRHLAVEREWRAALGDESGWVDVHVDSEPSTAAIEIERLSAMLGIELAPRGTHGRPRPSGTGRLRYARVAPDLTAHVRLGTALRPAPSVDGFLEAARAPIDALVDAALDGRSVTWGHETNLSSHVKLHQLLLVAALVRSFENDPATFRSFDASWKLAETLGPDLASRMVVIDIVRMQLGAVERIDGVPPRWVEELRRRDFRGDLVRALRAEGWRWLQLDDPVEALSFGAPRFSPRGDSPLRPLALLTGPYLKLCAADLSAAWLRGLTVLESNASLANLDPSTLTDEIAGEVGAWNLLDERAHGRLAESVTALMTLESERERTLELLARPGPAEGVVQPR